MNHPLPIGTVVQENGDPSICKVCRIGSVVNIDGVWVYQLYDVNTGEHQAQMADGALDSMWHIK